MSKSIHMEGTFRPWMPPITLLNGAWAPTTLPLPSASSGEKAQKMIKELSPVLLFAPPLVPPVLQQVLASLLPLMTSSLCRASSFFAILLYNGPSLLRCSDCGVQIPPGRWNRAGQRAGGPCSVPACSGILEHRLRMRSDG